MTKTGHVQFSHPEGTHDDRFWTIALAIYASGPEVPDYRPVFALARNPASLMPNLPRSMFRH